MRNEQQDSPSNSIQTILLIVIESFLTLILRFDSQLRQSAYPLAINGTVLAVRSYLPHDEIYVTFSFKGLLIDSELPPNTQRPDVIINAHSFEIVNAIISNKPQAVNKLQFRGDEEGIRLVKAFLIDLSVNQLLNNTFNRFINKQTTKSNDSASSSSNYSADESGGLASEVNNSANSEITKNSIDEAKTKKEEQKQKLLALREENNQLKIINKKQTTQLAELASRKRFFSILSLLTFIVGFCFCWLVL